MLLKWRGLLLQWKGLVLTIRQFCIWDQIHTSNLICGAFLLNMWIPYESEFFLCSLYGFLHDKEGIQNDIWVDSPVPWTRQREIPALFLGMVSVLSIQQPAVKTRKRSWVEGEEHWPSKANLERELQILICICVFIFSLVVHTFLYRCLCMCADCPQVRIARSLLFSVFSWEMRKRLFFRIRRKLDLHLNTVGEPRQPNS